MYKRFVCLALTLTVFAPAGIPPAQGQQNGGEISAETIATWRGWFTPTSDCALPCWWNIVPGKTSRVDARLLLQEGFGEHIRFKEYTSILYAEILAPITTVKEDLRDEFAEADLANSWFGVVFLHTNQDGIVQHIDLGLNLYYLDHAEEIMSYFETPNLFEQYGVPERISLQLIPTENGDRIVEMNLFWDDLALGAHHRVDVSIWNDDKFELYDPEQPACFNIATLSQYYLFDSAEYVFQSPDSDNSLEDSLNVIVPPNSLVEEVTGLTPAEFSEILIENDGCIPNDLPIIES